MGGDEPPINQKGDDMKEVWRTRIYLAGKKEPMDILQNAVLRDDNAMDAAQDVAHKLFNKKYFHFKEKDKEIYIPTSNIKKVVVDKIKIKEKKDAKKE